MDTSLTLNDISNQLEALNASGAFSSQGFKYLQGISHSDLLIARDSNLVDAFEEWYLTNDTKKLEKDLRNFIRAAHRTHALSPVAVPRIAAEPGKEAASPLGDFLQVQKKHQKTDMSLTIQLRQPEDEP